VKALWQRAGTCVAVSAALFAFLFVSVSLNKAYLRPAFAAGTILATLSGSYSNFIAAWTMGVSPACPVLTRGFSFRRGTAVVAAAAVGAFAILTIEELTSVFGVSDVRDVHDVAASALGSSCAVLTFLVLRRIALRRRRQPMPQSTS